MTVAGKGVRTCCDGSQLKTMDESLRLAEGILKRCTSCVKNLIRHICEYTCSPVQSNFIEPVGLMQNPMNGNKF
jgi:Niemann-Pick C1 protein